MWITLFILLEAKKEFSTIVEETLKRACFGVGLGFQIKIQPGVRNDLILFSLFALDKSQATEK